MDEHARDDVLAVARQVADELLAGAQAADDPARGVRRATLRRLADLGLYSVASPVADGGLGAGESTLGEVEGILAGADGATWFVLTQHRLPQALTATPGAGPAAARHREALARGDALAGIAVAHLRRPGTPVRAEPHGAGWRLHGRADWCTGWGLVDLVLVGAQTADDRVVFALLDARTRPGLRASGPLALAVMGGTRTVALDLDAAAVAPDEVVLVVDGADWRARDAGTVLDTKYAALGLLARVVAETDRHGRERDRPAAVATAAALAEEAQPLRERALALRRAAADDRAGAHAQERVALRGRLAELTVRAAGALVAARGGSAMLAGSHEQRWWREAGFHLVQAQNDTVRAAQLGAMTRLGDAPVA